jgi:BMFP domain-containing protein YqiC
VEARHRAAGAPQEDSMADRPKMFDDLAGIAGGAFSALAGLREEAEAIVRARIDETLRKLDLVRREEFDAVAQLAANARAGQEAAEARLADLAARLAALEARVQAQAPAQPAGRGGPGMIA